MKRKKIILIVTSIVAMLSLVVCIGIAFAFESTTKLTFTLDPTRVTNMGRQITDYELPTGYSPRSAISFLGTTSVKIDDDETGEQAIFFGEGFGRIRHTPDLYLRKDITDGFYKGTEWQVVGLKPVSVHGENTTVTIYDGVGQDGTKYLAWVCPFTGKNGPAILVIVMPEDSWDETVAQTFVDSIH